MLLDYDGTLTPIVDHPDQAGLSAAARQALASLAALPRVQVGVLSGRGLANLRSMVELPGLIYGGNSGLELELAGAPSSSPRHKRSRKSSPELTAS